ncbi:MAG: 2,3-bisphosphoglycerate-independent phosphoglycerate mutase [Actinobacteria bacterium HGW-Actinobacteria-9]|jgi:2,3-bisphosphoglycerate-independent phosphoglycerate mutase|nr:MAG: 2,3-bisphosphoglycerate-independent phosphoglycerate mutase [Actinobacteria bacterium HGW-Actinobacteria-9]
MRNLPCALLILDGFGAGAPGASNAIDAARTPNLDALFAQWPTTTLSASGLAVGLPQGQMGNSEVGHLNIGAGRVVYQELTRINLAVEDGSLLLNDALSSAVDGAVRDGRAVHFMGLVSDGGVHSHQSHLYALVEMAAARGATEIYVHCFLDGRDVPPESGADYVASLVKRLEATGVARVATVMGRYYAMDRDNRWERVEKAWEAMVLGEGMSAKDPVAAIRDSYAAGITDEFVIPTVMTSADGLPLAPVADGDALVFFNFRPDRAREITRAFVDPTFNGFVRPLYPDVRFVCLTQYDPTIPAPVAFPKDLPSCVLADVLANEGLRQLHIAETEKYAHVTFFLNGGVETLKPAEERILVPSPKVPTYDLQPEMSAPEVTDALVAAIESDRADVYLVNYANCDMVGHTGVFEAAVAAVEAVDRAVGSVVTAILERGGSVIITADHGNAEKMVDADGVTPFTAHTAGDVPLCVIARDVVALESDGMLADVAPTLLALISVRAPVEWTGRSLLVY